MRSIGILFMKELKSYLVSPVTYVVSAIFLVLSGSFFTAYLAGTNYSDTSIRGFLDAAQLLIILFATILTMRLLAEERKLGTWELMLTIPIRSSEIVLGKFFGSFAILLGMLALTLYYPFLLALFGDPDVGSIVSGYVGLVLLGAASLGVGVFASSLTSNQIVSAVVGGGILFGLWLLGMAAHMLPPAVARLLSQLSLSQHYSDFEKGLIDTRAIVYYLSVVIAFLYLATRSTEADRWR